MESPSTNSTAASTSAGRQPPLPRPTPPARRPSLWAATSTPRSSSPSRASSEALDDGGAVVPVPLIEAFVADPRQGASNETTSSGLWCTSITATRTPRVRPRKGPGSCSRGQPTPTGSVQSAAVWRTSAKHRRASSENPPSIRATSPGATSGSSRRDPPLVPEPAVESDKSVDRAAAREGHGSGGPSGTAACARARAAAVHSEDEHDRRVTQSPDTARSASR